ncbi:MAG: septum formation initiator family protein [Candidatus Borkfalkiaceae bacterium]|nr:septum formation initiator family protein [Christensenellaceae bacterium]
MKIEKLKKVAASATAAAVLLLVILISVMVYQLISIKAKENEINRIKAEIARLEEQDKELEDNIDIWLSDWKIYERARELEYIKKGDK